MRTRLSHRHGVSNTPLCIDTIGTRFDRIAQSHPDNDALISRHQNIRWTYRQLAERVDTLAVALMRLGLKPGERIGIWAQNCAEWVVTQFATAKVGLVLVTINPAGGAEEVRHVLGKAACKALILSPSFRHCDHIATLQTLAPERFTAASDQRGADPLPQLQIVVRLGMEKSSGMLNFDELLVPATAAELAALHSLSSGLQCEDPISILFTSGTTGRPKGATLTHRGLINNAFFVGEAMGITHQDRFCILLPLYHCGAMVLGNLDCVTHGATMIYPSESYDAKLAIQTVEQERCTAVGGVPSMFIGMLEDPDFPRWDLTSLRTGYIGGAPCPTELMKRLTTQMHLRDITIAFGMTETSPISFQTCPADTLEQRVGTVGRVGPHLEAKLVDAEGRTVPLGEQGEILVRGYSVMAGYWDDPQATAAAIDRGGWMHTNDVGVMDEAGYVRVVGRLNDMIIRAGENIYPREVEEFLFQHPKIEQVAVFGIDDPLYGEDVCAWIKLRQSQRATAEEIVHFCRGRVADAKIPRRIRFVDEFPMTVNGKIQKYVIREQTTRELAGKAATADTSGDSGGGLQDERTEARSEVDRERTQERVAAVLTAKFAEVMNLPETSLDADQPFADFGLDSLLGIRVVASINRALAIELTTTSLFDHGCIRKLARHVGERFAEAHIEQSLARRQPSSMNDQDAPDASAADGEWRMSKAAQPGTDVNPARGADSIENVASRTVQELGSSDPTAQVAIAIVGMSGRFGSASTVQELWNCLATATDLTEEASRWKPSECLPNASDRSKGYCRVGGFLRDIDCFDPRFFGISGAEATYMDPQQRLFLQEAWKALEDAGRAGAASEGQRCGIYVGHNTGCWDYSQLLSNERPANALWGTSAAFIPARIAYYLDLRGPAVAVDTACSSSLVAIHLACQSLRTHETDMALAGGVFLQCTPAFYQMCNQAGMLSPTGRCYAFDDRADGFVPGEGVGVLVLRRLTDALADGDHIHGVIRGSGINQDGATNGITAPSAAAQEELQRQVHTTFGIHAEEIQMMEAHGTGTKLGDPIEFEALSRIFRRDTAKQGFCALGSIKTNLGHTAAAAGVASVIKVLLSLQHQRIPASLHYETTNSRIDITNSPFYVNTTLREWPQSDTGRAAAVSSFGLSGTNAHLVIAEAPPIRRTPANKPGYLVVLSARSSGQLREQVEQLVAHCESAGPIDCGDISYTLLLGRKHFNQRLACVAASTEQLLESLQQWLVRGEAPRVHVSKPDAQRQGPATFKRLGNQCIKECAQLTDSAAYLENLAAIAALFVEGCRLDFEGLFVGRAFSRINLPTYPFARERYWIEPPAVSAPSEPTVEVMRFEERWQDEALSLTPSRSIRRVLCFVDGVQQQREVTQALHALDAQVQVICIGRGERYEALAEGHYRIESQDGASYEQVFRHVREVHGAVDALLYLWGLEDSAWVSEAGVIVRVLQGLWRAQLPCERVLLAGEMDAGVDGCHVESWIGFERSVRSVLPDTQVAVIGEGVPKRSGGQWRGEAVSRWLQRLWSELQGSRSESVRYEGARRQVLGRVRQAPQPGAPVLQSGGTYLLTGGLGGLGWLVAQHLARRYGARLILTGRSALDESKRQKLRALEECGARVTYICADVCEVEQMRAGLREARAQFGALSGVIHAAGLQGGGSVLDTPVAQFEQVLAPKVRGTLALEAVLAQEAPAVVCYFSSAAAILGDFGACAYAVANRFQMAYAQQRQRERGRTVAINWPLWQDGGMGLESAAQQLYLKSSGQQALQSVQGLALLEGLLSEPCTHSLVMVGEPEQIQRIVGVTSSARPSVDRSVEASTLPRNARPAALRGRSLEDCVGWELKQLVSELLKLPREQLEMQENLAQFGFDSISLAQFAERLTQHYGIGFSPGVFFSHPTLQQLRTFLLTEHAAAMQVFYGESHGESPSVSRVTSAAAAPAVARRSHPSVDLTGIRAPTAPAREPSAAAPEPIAIIGMSGRFPQARDVQELWKILESGAEAVSVIPPERFDWRACYSEQADAVGKSNGKWLGALPGVAEFDASFFEISPREAQLMDPRQRLLLQESWKALEDAGYGSEQLKRDTVGMFVGVEQGDYQLLVGGRGGVTGNHDAVLAARLSYFLNLRGPTMALNTACSSGLVALHQACHSLRAQECDTALAAAVSLLLTPHLYLGMSQAGMLSPEGICYAFDRRANGMVPAEAVVSIVLKRLSQAQADGDPIHAVIRGSGINYDGKTNGITAPSGAAQTQLIKAVYERAQLRAEEVGDLQWVVTHGTGTRLGDPVEINALNDALRQFTAAQRFCALTSPKSNFGHTLAASGLLSLVALVQGLRHELIPASLHCEQESDYIDWAASAFYVNKTARPWPQPAGGRRLGAVSAFGMSGTNAHVLVESYVPPAASAASARAAPYVLIALSAKSETALQRRVRDLREYLQQGHWDAAALRALSYTLLWGRQHFAHRCALVIDTVDSAIHWLGSVPPAERQPHYFSGTVPREFAGQQALQRYAHDLLKQLPAHEHEPREYQQQLYALADLYCQGYELPWQHAFEPHPPRRLNLPTYPFDPQQHWIDADDGLAMNAILAQPTLRPAKTSGPHEPGAEHSARVTRMLTKQWQPSALAATQNSANNLLILSCEATRNVANQLAQRFAGSKVLSIDDPQLTTVGDEFWASRAGWIDLVGCAPPSSKDLHWLRGLQKWIETAPHAAKVLCVTRGLETYQNATPNLGGADRVGLYRMLPSEYGRLRSTHMDADPGNDEETLIEEIAAEFCSTGDAAEVCYRDGVRYLARLQEKRLGNGHVHAPAPLEFPPDQVLWITGGTRGLGYLCAQHFVRNHCVKKLVLTGREVLPPREQWSAHVSEDGSVARKIRAVQALEREGARVEILSVRLADSEALRRSFAQMKQTLGPVGGVIHCAGLAADENPAFIRKTLDSVARVLEPKVSGLDNLIQCVQHEPLRFLVLFSSVSAIVPALAVGQSDYAMANAYMDYVAQVHAAALPIVSLQWPSWKETGMGESTSPTYRQLGFCSQTNAEGLQLLDTILAKRPSAVVLPAVVDASRWQPDLLMQHRLRPAAMPHRSGDEQPSRAAAGELKKHSDRVAAADPSWLKALIARELKIEPGKLDNDVPLQHYGADSILLVQMMRQVGERVGERVDPSILFEHQTINSFWNWLSSTYGAALSAAPLPDDAGENPPADESNVSAEGAPSGVDTRRHDPEQVSASKSSEGERAAADSRRAGGGHRNAEDIAVVGLSCRFPGGANIEEYWQLLAQGRSAIRPVPSERWGYASKYNAGVLDDITHFDPAFFLISTADARAMDPQSLLVLEESLGLWYHAGYSLQQMKGQSVGVYLGARSEHWPQAEALQAAHNPIMAVGPNYLAANVSRFFDLRGPSVVIDTACSSALVAMNMAAQSLRSGEITSALVGGVSLLNTDKALRLFEQRGILNRASSFHLFDRRAQGAILGEGIGLVWLKTVDQALRDGDCIYAVVKALAINNDGRTAGPAAPNLQAQKEVMQQALAKSGKRAGQISHIEVNGSGSQVTDLLELKAIQSVYRPASAAACELGSIKPNIGHPLCAEGIASFIKCVLMLQHRRRVPFLSAQEPMSHYDFSASAFRFARALCEWDHAPTVAAVNSFADGGTNAHVILEAWEEPGERQILHRPLPVPVLHRVDVQARPGLAGESSGEQGVNGSEQLPVAVESGIHLQDHVLWGSIETVN